MADETSRRCRVCGWTGVHACVADETNAGGLSDAERAMGKRKWVDDDARFFDEEAVERIVAERVRVAVEQRDGYERVLTEAALNHQARENRERAARLALVAGIEALEPDVCDCREAFGHLTRCRWLKVRALLSPADTAALDAVKAAAWDEGATKATPHGGGYLRSLLIENPYRADTEAGA